MNDKKPISFYDHLKTGVVNWKREEAYLHRILDYMCEIFRIDNLPETMRKDAVLQTMFMHGLSCTVQAGGGIEKGSLVHVPCVYSDLIKTDNTADRIIYYTNDFSDEMPSDSVALLHNSASDYPEWDVYRYANQLASIDKVQRSLIKRANYGKVPVAYNQTEQQENYFYRDTAVMYHYMMQQPKNNLFAYVNTLPLTKTGAVRKTINRMFPQKYDPTNSELFKCNQSHMKRCKQLNEVIEKDDIFSFFAAKSFSGGQVGINPERKGQIQTDVYSMDLTSSYPTVLCACKYPDGKPHETTAKIVFQKMLEWSRMPMLDCLADAVSADIGFLANITFKNLRIKPEFVNFPFAKYMVARIEKDLYLMKNDAAKLASYTVGNIEAYQHSISSKIYRADVVTLCLLHTDLAAISKLYTYDDIQVNRVYTYKMTYSDYLQKVIERFARQKSFSKQLLKDWDKMKQSPETYENEFMAFTEYPYFEHAKTLSKAEFETQYYIMVDKAQFNANYGINAESPFKQNYIPTEFEIAEQDIITATRKTTSLMIGSYCTSYARLELLCGFLALQDMGGTFLYCDTDSLKFTDAEFKPVNDTANMYLRYVFVENEITKKYGFLRFDFDGHYDLFITNAPKFYMYTADGKETIHTKLSGFSELEQLAAELQREYSTSDVLRILSLNNLRLSTELVTHLDHITHMSNNLYVLLQYIPKMLSQNTHSITLEKIRYNFENIFNVDSLKNYDYSKIHDMTYRKTPVLL